MKVFSFSWKVILTIITLSFVLSGSFVLYSMALNDGGFSTGDLVFFSIEIVLCILLPLIYVCRSTWRSTRSVVQILKNALITILIQAVIQLLPTAIIIFLIYREEMYYFILRSLPI